MRDAYWHRQDPAKPLFPDLAWSKPENKQLAGKLFVIGGNLHGFTAPAEAYMESMDAGVGLTRVLLPDAVKKHVGKLIETVEYAPSTPSGSFAQASLAEWLDGGAWADAVLLSGNLGRNSETAIVLEKFISKYVGKLTLTRDAVDYILEMPELVLLRPDTLLVVTVAELQKLVSGSGSTKAITFSMDLLQMIDALHELTKDYEAHIILKHLDTLLVAVNGQVSTTHLPKDLSRWRIKTAAHAAVWWLQNTYHPFESLTVGVQTVIPSSSSPASP